MAGWSKLCAFITRLVPEVRRADRRTTPYRQKATYTAIVLFVFLTSNQLPLYGIPVQRAAAAAPDPLHWGHPIFTQPDGSLLALGIGPVLLSEILTRILVDTNAAPEILTRILVDTNAASEARTLQLMGILLTIVGAIAHVLGLCLSGRVSTAGNAVLALLQILFSGTVVIYLDDILKKGYGLCSSVSLFTATTICGNILWKAFSPRMFIYPEQRVEYEGAVPALVHPLITRTDKLSAIREAFCRGNLPNVTSLLATCLFVPIAISFQALSSVVLPVRARRGAPGSQFSYLIKTSNMIYGPIVLHRFLVSSLYNISQLLSMKYGGNQLLNLLGTWSRPNRSGQSFLVGGILHCITTPPTLADLHRAPLRAFVYVVYVLGACAYLSVLWLRICVSSKRFIDGFIVLNEEQRALAQPDPVPPREFSSHVLKAARLGGLCAGALIILGDFIGVLGSGTGVMLAVTALYPYFDGRPGEVGAFGF